MTDRQILKELLGHRELFTATDKNGHTTTFYAKSLDKAVEMVQNHFDLSLEPYTVERAAK